MRLTGGGQIGGGRFCAEDALEDGVGEGFWCRRKRLGVLPPGSGSALHFGVVKLTLVTAKVDHEQLASVCDKAGLARRDTVAGDELDEIAEDFLDGSRGGEVRRRAKEAGGEGGTVLAVLLAGVLGAELTVVGSAQHAATMAASVHMPAVFRTVTKVGHGLVFLLWIGCCELGICDDIDDIGAGGYPPPPSFCNDVYLKGLGAEKRAMI